MIKKLKNKRSIDKLRKMKKTNNNLVSTKHTFHLNYKRINLDFKFDELR